jgi:Notch-like protein
MEYLLQIFKNSFPNIKCNYTLTKEIENIIKSLKPTNSHGCDEMSAKILKASSHFISSPLTYICNKSLATGIFSSRLKYSIIKPIFKKGDKNPMSEYRPMSLLTSFSKIFEKVMYVRLYQHLIDNNILVNERFEFTANSSTDMATYKLLNALNNKLMVGGIL